MIFLNLMNSNTRIEFIFCVTVQDQHLGISEANTQNTMNFNTRIQKHLLDILCVTQLINQVFLWTKQVGDVLTAHITIEDGFLKVPKEQTSLQKFLHIHPDNGTVFKELDERKESLEILEKEQILYNALKIVNEEPYKTLEIIARVFLPYFSEYWNSDIVKKELALGAKQNPSRLIKISKDPYLLEKGMAQIAINRGNLIYNNQRFSTANGDFILDVPRGEDKYDAIGKFFKSDNGKSYFEYYKSLL
jgi:hypothetical protein